MDCSLPDYSVHGILLARTLEWVAMPSSGGSSQLRDGTSVSCISCNAANSLPLSQGGSHICKVHHAKCRTGIKLAGRNINYLRYADDTTFMAENEEELKSLLMKVKEESEKIGLKLNIQ